MKNWRAAIMIAVSCVCLAVAQVRAMPAVGAYFDAAGHLSAVPCMPYAPVRIFIVLTDSPVASVDGLRMGYAVIPLGAAPSTVYRLSQSLFGATGTVSGDALAGAYDLIWETPRAAGTNACPDDLGPDADICRRGGNLADGFRELRRCRSPARDCKCRGLVPGAHPLRVLRLRLRVAERKDERQLPDTRGGLRLGRGQGTV
jgi:hypothetical protein